MLSQQQEPVSYTHLDVYKRQTYTGSLGYDYLLDRDYYDWFYLSSEIGYIKRSGKNAITGSKLNMDHLHLNTLFKVKYSFENLMMSAGVGPSVDYRVIKGGQSNKLVFGARPEIGLSYFLSNRICLLYTSQPRSYNGWHPSIL